MNETEEGLRLTTETTGGVTRVLVRGAMNVNHVRQFYDFVGQAVDTSTDLAIDLDEVDAIDVSGLQVLLALRTMLVHRGRAMWLQRTPDIVNVALQRAGLQGTLVAKVDENDSVAAVDGKDNMPEAARE